MPLIKSLFIYSCSNILCKYYFSMAHNSNKNKLPGKMNKSTINYDEDTDEDFSEFGSESVSLYPELRNISSDSNFSNDHLSSLLSSCSSNDESSCSSKANHLYPMLNNEHEMHKPVKRKGRRSIETTATPPTSNSFNTIPVTSKHRIVNANLYYPILLFLIALILCTLWKMFSILSFTQSFDTLNEKLYDFNDFVKGVDSLKDSYPEQDERFWRTVKASTRHIFYSHTPEYPAVLLLASDERDRKNVAHVAIKIAEIFANVVGKAFHIPSTNGVIDLSMNNTSGADEQKLRFDEQLKENLNSMANAVVVQHLELLKPRAALLLHSYCDGDSAPNKLAMLILCLYLRQPAYTAQQVETTLHKMWASALPEDKVASLLSRVANNVVIWKTNAL